MVLKTHIYLALLSEGYGKLGRVGEGLSALVEALAVVDKTGERYYEAELYRLRGELTLQQFKVQGSKFKGSPESEVSKSQSLNPKSQEEAEVCFLKAIEVARKQQAKSLELRATMSLARLWQQQGKKATKLTNCCQMSTTDLPRALIPKICKRQGR